MAQFYRGWKTRVPEENPIIVSQGVEKVRPRAKYLSRAKLNQIVIITHL